MKQETIICGGEKCDREATHLLMSVMLRDGRIPEGFLADVANPESTFPTCPMCLEEHASKMENLDQRPSTKTKNRYVVNLTEEHKHCFEVEAGSEDDATEKAMILCLDEDTNHDSEFDLFIEDVELQDDETVASIVVACS